MGGEVFELLGDLKELLGEAGPIYKHTVYVTVHVLCPCMVALLEGALARVAAGAGLAAAAVEELRPRDASFANIGASPTVKVIIASLYRLDLGLEEPCRHFLSAYRLRV